MEAIRILVFWACAQKRGSKVKVLLGALFGYFIVLWWGCLLKLKNRAIPYS